MAYHEYDNGSKRHQNGHRMRRLTFAEVQQQQQVAREKEIRQLCTPLVALMGDEYSAFIDGAPDDYQEFIQAIKNKLSEYECTCQETPDAAERGQMACRSCRDFHKRIPF